MKVPLLDLKPQYAGIREAVRQALDGVCDSQAFILGPVVEALEREIATYCGATAGVGMSSGTDALLASLMAAGVGPGDAVITSPYTFFATAGSIARLGATTWFADVDPQTLNLDPIRVKALLESPPARFKKKHPKVLLPVHLFGQCADMAPLMELASAHKLMVIEDAAQAIGSEYRLAGAVRRAGAMGAMGCYSFFPSKNLGGFGDGGMVVTSDPVLAESLKRIRNHGMHPKYFHSMVGGNFRLDAIQAAVLRVKLPHLDAWHEARRRHAARYDAAFAGTRVTPPTARYRADGLAHHHIYNQYVVRVPNRDAVRERMTRAEIGCEVYYPVPLHLQECFKDLGYRQGDFPVSEQAARETLALPVYPELTGAMQDEVIRVLLNAVSA